MSRNRASETLRAAAYRLRALTHLVTWLALVTTLTATALVAVLTLTPALVWLTHVEPTAATGMHVQAQPFVAVPSLLWLVLASGVVSLLGTLAGGLRRVTR